MDPYNNSMYNCYYQNYYNDQQRISPAYSQCSPDSHNSLYEDPSGEDYNGFNFSLKNELEGYRRKDIQSWNGEDCFDWAYSAGKLCNIFIEKEVLMKFKEVNGRILLNFNSDEFCQFVESFNGQQLFDYFLETKSELKDLNKDDPHLPPKKNSRFRPQSPAYSDSPSYSESSYNHQYDRDVSENYVCSYASSELQINEDIDLLKKIYCGRRNRGRNPKSWEFLLRLLRSEKYNPSIIKWEDEENGTFRLIKKDDIACLWAGRAQQKPKAASYDSFARILRYHYKTKALVPVSEKHLVYKFSEEVMETYRKNENL